MSCWCSPTVSSATRPRLSEFDDSKASVLGDYLPTKLGMDGEERVLWACIPGDYSGQLLFCFENGKTAGWSCPPIRPRPGGRS